MVFNIHPIDLFFPFCFSFQIFGIGSCCHQRNWSILTGQFVNINAHTYSNFIIRSFRSEGPIYLTFAATFLLSVCVLWGSQKSVCVGATGDGQLLLMQAHAVPFELNWRVWLGLGHIVLSKLCCFKIAKWEARVPMFCVRRGVCAAHCVHTVGLHAATQKSCGAQLVHNPASRALFNPVYVFRSENGVWILWT